MKRTVSNGVPSLCSHRLMATEWVLYNGTTGFVDPYGFAIDMLHCVSLGIGPFTYRNCELNVVQYPLRDLLHPAGYLL